MDGLNIENFKNKSPVDNAIAQLIESRTRTNERLALAKDKYEIEIDNNGKVNLINKETNETLTFEIETLLDAEHPLFNDAYSLLFKEFKSNELDPKPLMAEQMRGFRCGYPIDDKGTRAVLFTLSKNIESKNNEDQNINKKEVTSVLDGILFPLQDNQGMFTNECAFMVSYVNTKKDKENRENDYRRYGFGRELMIAAYKYAKIKAESRSFIGAVGECTYTSRDFWEKVGWKRIYIKKKGAELAKWEEITYVQPPLDFDTETGEIVEGSGDAPEHLMVNLFDENTGQDPTVGEKLSRIVEGMYKTNNEFPPESFGLFRDKQTEELKPLDPNTDKKNVANKIKAYEKHYESVYRHLRNFEKQFEGMDVRFLTKDEIDKEGLEVKDYITGDDEAKMLKEKLDTKTSDTF